MHKCGIALARCAITRESGIKGDAIEIRYTSLGKPYLPHETGMHISISHSGGYVICAVSRENIGSDIEYLDRIERSDYIKIASRFFSDEEIHYLQNAGKTRDQITAFAEIWTKKEAYAKLDGRGLRLPFPSFSVLSAPGVHFAEVPVSDSAICHICTEKPASVTVLPLSLSETENFS